MTAALIEKAAAQIARSRCTLALTGAGISVESGIPDFRSASGLWARYNPAEYATIEAFCSDPHKVWKMLREMEALLGRAQPNPAHLGLGELEKLGCLHGIITQNVDNLHQLGGSTNVIEYHGNAATLSCLSCGRGFTREEKADSIPPLCDCGSVLKPDVIFFGEAIPAAALDRSYQLAARAEVLMVVGTSAVVSPANTIPSTAKQHGASIIEINLESTHLTNSVTDIFLEGRAGHILPMLVEAVNQISKNHQSTG